MGRGARTYLPIVDGGDRVIIAQAGAGKTFTAVTLSHRLLKHGGFHRILFLVDRNKLADRTMREFRDSTTPDDGQKFTELYNGARRSNT